MNPEDRLRDAAKSYTDPIQPAPDVWARIRERVGAEPLRRRVPAAQVALAGFATAIVIALLVTLVAVMRDDGNGGTGVTAGPSGERPDQIVAITDDGRVVVVDAEDGRELQTLAEGAVTNTRDGYTLQVSPDGRTVFFIRNTDTVCEGTPVTEIARVDVETGVVEGVAYPARYLALSPNGRLLAYTGLPNCFDSGSSITIIDPGTDGGKQFTSAIASDIGFLSWAPDSRHLTYALFTAAAGSFPRVIDTETQASLDEPPRVFNPDGSRVHGYHGATGEFIGTRAPGGNEPEQRLAAVAFDLASGDIDRILFRLPEPCCGQTVAADATGRHVVAVGAFPSGLYRWSDGDREPTRIADGIVAAAWLPEVQRAPVTPTEIVAAKSDGRLVVLSRETGAELRQLADGIDADTTIAVTPDGERVFFDRPSSPESDPPRELLTVLTSGGEVNRLIGGAGQPAVSPDGRLLAFVRYRPAGLQVVEIPDTFEGWIPNVVGDGEASGTSQVVIAPSWAPDSRHLVFTVVTTPEGSPPRVAELGYGMRLDAAPPIPVPVPSCAVTSYLGDTGLVAVAHGGDRAIAVDPASGQEVRELFRGPGLGCGADRPLASDPSGAHLLYVTSGTGPALYRWSEGDADPIKVADGIVAAAWVSGPAPEPPPTTLATEAVVVPAVLGFNEADARAALAEVGLDRRVVYTPAPERGSGIVLQQDPSPGSMVPPGAAVDLVIGPVARELPCGPGVSFSPTYLPDGFRPEPIPGAGTTSATSTDTETPTVLHYSDGAGRVIEVHHPGTRFVEILDADDEYPNVIVLGRGGTLAPIAPTVDEPVVVAFSFSDEPPVTAPCATWSLDGYGVTEPELRAFAEGLVLPAGA